MVSQYMFQNPFQRSIQNNRVQLTNILADTKFGNYIVLAFQKRQLRKLSRVAINIYLQQPEIQSKYKETKDGNRVCTLARTRGYVIHSPELSPFHPRSPPRYRGLFYVQARSVHFFFFFLFPSFQPRDRFRPQDLRSSRWK